MGVKAKYRSSLHGKQEQNLIESTTFGAEMVAMRTARDLTVALHIFRESAAVGIRSVAKAHTNGDKSDAVTKILPHPIKLHFGKHFILAIRN